MDSTSKASALANLKARRQQATAGSLCDSPEAAGGSSPASTSKTPATTAHGTQPPAAKLGEGALAAPPQPSLPPPQAPQPPQPQPPQPPAQPPLPTRAVESFAWQCELCARECVPVRSESRCLCGHRLREHEPASTQRPSRCKSAKCSCRGFFFIVAEGAWVLRCRCKHKHVEHDPASHACAKAGCGCGAFDSPWVCNCDHPWAQHTQRVVVKEVVSVRDMLGGMSLGEVEVGGGGPAREVNDYDALKRGEFGSQQQQ